MQSVPSEAEEVAPQPTLLSLIDPTKRLQFATGALVLMAGFVHALAGESHFSIWWGYGLFFSIVSICQIMGGAALFFWNSRQLQLIGIAGTAVVVAVYVLTRTVGIPWGPEAGVVESVGPLDFFSKALEVCYTGCLVALLARGHSSAVA